MNPFRYCGYYQDTETGFYYLMSRYYDTVTHRFVNADAYFQTGNNIIDVNMNIYCRNNPVNCFDPTGRTVFTLGLGGYAFAGLGAGGSIYYAVDDKGNSGIFLSYIDYNESAGVGLFSGSAGVTGGVIWDADTIDDLYQNYANTGFSVGEGLTVGGDLITLNDEPNPSGISLSIGFGVGIDYIHTYTTTTVPLYTNYVSKSNSNFKSNSINSTPKKTVKNSKKQSNGKKRANTIKIGNTTYKICPICGCPHIILK